MRKKIFILLTLGLFLSILSKSFNFKQKKTIISPQVFNISQTISHPEQSEGSSNKTQIEKLSLEKILQDNHTWTSTLSASKTIRFIATGDVIPARVANYTAVSKNDFSWPFAKTMNLLKNGDITFINLEAPLVKYCPLTNTGMVFCGDQRNVGGLLMAGVDVANLANNHSANHGKEGVIETVELLRSVNIATTGVSGIYYKKIKGVSFAFLGYNDIEKNPNISSADEEKIKIELEEARKNADIVVVAFHWGDEYTAQPNKRQIELAHLAVDNGADLIIGNHPHWIQPIELYKGKFIMYAHGNFVFDQMWSEKTKQGVVGIYTFYGKELVDIEFLPVYIKDYGQPYFLEGSSKQRILENLKTESLKLRAST